MVHVEEQDFDTTPSDDANHIGQLFNAVTLLLERATEVSIEGQDPNLERRQQLDVLARLQQVLQSVGTALQTLSGSLERNR